MTRGVSISERTIWSFRESVEVDNWKRYKIGDSVVVARRFRSIPFSPLPSKVHEIRTDPTSRSSHVLVSTLAQMVTGFVTRLRSRSLRFRLSSLALSHLRTLQARSRAHSRPNTASLVQEALSSQPALRSPFLIDRWLLKVPLLIVCTK